MKFKIPHDFVPPKTLEEAVQRLPLKMRLGRATTAEILKNLNRREVAEFLSLEERLEGLTLEDRLEGLTLEDRLKGLNEEELKKVRELLDKLNLN